MKKIRLCFAAFMVILVVSLTVSAQQDAGRPPNTGGTPLTVTLPDALKMAQANSPEFRSAVTDAGVAHEDKVQARADMLPAAAYNSQFIYTEGNGTSTGRFIGANGVHEYLAEGNAHQVVGLAPVAEFRRSQALEAVARAKQEIAARGLVVTVVKAYYGLVVTQRKYANAQLANAAAQDLVTISQQQEKGGEVAHADVVKAQLLLNDSARALSEAQLAMLSARLDLAVLIFPDFRQDFTVVDDLRLPAALPELAQLQKMAMTKNPELAQAQAGLRAAKNEVLVAWAGHLPSLSFDYFYGIDANRFATRTDGVRNLGYQATATLSLPIFNWGATQSKVKQANLREKQASVELSFAQRQLAANFQRAYAEAQVARSELDSLANSAELAEESARLTTMRYKAGEATILEVVDAQNTLAQARNAYDDGQLRYRVALAALQTVTGSF